MYLIVLHNDKPYVYKCINKSCKGHRNRVYFLFVYFHWIWSIPDHSTKIDNIYIDQYMAKEICNCVTLFIKH